MTTKRVHPTKVDFWLVCVLLACAGVSLIALLRVSKERPAETGAVMATTLVAWAVFVLLTWPTSYVVKDQTLIIRSGLLRWIVPLVDIIEVSPTSLPVSAPAWSLDRLVVRFRKNDGEGIICISPKDKAEFLAALAHEDPNLQVIGERILRRTIEGL